MNLFICRTVFQAYYASIIIKKKGIDNVKFFYLSDKYTEREAKVVSDYCSDCIVVSDKNKTIKLLKQILMLFKISRMHKKNKGDEWNLYFSSIDDPFIQTIISRFKFNSLYSFDDGTANYIKSSMYYVDRKRTFLVKAKYFLMGNRLKSINDVKKKIRKHYCSTLISNIISDIELVPLVDIDALNDVCQKHNDLNVYLCPNFNELYIHPRQARELLLSMLVSGDVIIPHPRDDFLWGELEDITVFNSSLAEIYISDLIKSGYGVNLFGIANSTQYHYAFLKSVKNYILDLGVMTEFFDKAITEQVNEFKALTSKYRKRS